MYITVIGGGNSSYCFSVLAATAGHTVALLTRKPIDWKNPIEVINDDLAYISADRLEARLHVITNDYAEVIPKSDMIIIAGVPIHHNPQILQKLKPLLATNRKVFIGTICAYGGFNWVAKRILGPGSYSLFGTQLIPWTCGTVEYGKSGRIIGAKRLLRIATESGMDIDGVKAALNPILRMDLQDTDFLASTLWPNNPSLHPPILYGLFKDWDGKTPYDPKTLPVRIYADLTQGSANSVVQLDEELVRIVASLAKIYPNNPHLQKDFSLKACIIENYEEQVVDKSDTVSCVKTNIGFAKHYLPYQQVTGGIVPILDHKFFITDLPFGLVTFKDISLMANIETPVIDSIILWNQKLINKEYLVEATGKLDGRDIHECVCPSKMGFDLKTLNDASFKFQASL